VALILGDPFDRSWFHLGCNWTSTIFTAASFESTDQPNRHIVITQNLTTQSATGKPFRGEEVLLGNSHHGWFAINELDAARSASSLSSASMQLVRRSFFAQGAHKPLSSWNFKRTDSFNS
jgi:hypothetical protein